MMVMNFSLHLDYLVLGVETGKGYAEYNGTSYVDGATWYELFNLLKPWKPGLTVDMFKASTTAGVKHLGDHFLDEMLQRLADVKPDYVLECESDASFEWGRGFEEDLAEFIRGDYDTMYMLATCPTVNGHVSPTYPWTHHCRAYKWYPGIYYRGGLCKVSPQYPGVKPSDMYLQPSELPLLQDAYDKYKPYTAKSHLLHLANFTPKLQEERWKFYGYDLVKVIYEVGNPRLPLPDLSFLLKGVST